MATARAYHLRASAFGLDLAESRGGLIYMLSEVFDFLAGFIARLDGLWGETALSWDPGLAPQLNSRDLAGLGTIVATLSPLRSQIDWGWAVANPETRVSSPPGDTALALQRVASRGELVAHFPLEEGDVGVGEDSASDRLIIEANIRGHRVL